MPFEEATRIQVERAPPDSGKSSRAQENHRDNLAVAARDAAIWWKHYYDA